ncbi:serine/threonine-protein kinase-like protein At1g28390 [Abrus precatorius]|uniref:Serine/threonine-protein kinase-like protein At1g28390 n=1 Tax=Abrus precatorius TaxID=3816 RepID=A0A8B8JP42_ABRPR|nr:serine/threonine-protein kinase-like protein At1g28390 [Abrus precatorius]
MGYFSCNGESAIATCDPHYWDLKKKPTGPTKAHHNNLTVKHFDYTDLLAATNSFSADNFLGKGSYGSVYKATLDGGHLIAAVKKTKPSAASHHNAADNEIEILSHVTSPRLVNLIGFCNDRNNKLIVVEYMPNGSLYELLHSNTVRPPGWNRRVRFAVQVAKAVRGLHCSEPPVIHRDIKSSNVLIDEKWNARLGDFGLALRGHVEDVRVKCTPPAGTLGYLDPSYLAPGDLSVKSDVFSFGILLLEIASGRNAIDVNHSPPSVLDWAVPLIRRGEFAGICDRRIGAPPDAAAFREMVVMAARCVRSTVEKRPSMAEVVECLKAVRKRFHAPVIWKRLKRRVATRGKMLGNDCDRSEEVVRVVKGGNRRNGKVSSVTGVEYESEPANPAVRIRLRSRSRSRSIGSGFFSDIKMRSVLDPNLIGLGFGSRKGKMLKRSRSMGHYGSEAKTFHEKRSDNNNDTSCSTEMALSKLAIADKKLEQRMLEKPLVYSHRFENPSN